MKFDFSTFLQVGWQDDIHKKLSCCCTIISQCPLVVQLLQMLMSWGGAERVSCTQGLASNQSVYILDKVPDEDMSV